MKPHKVPNHVHTFVCPSSPCSPHARLPPVGLVDWSLMIPFLEQSNSDGSDEEIHGILRPKTSIFILRGNTAFTFDMP
jgi:hypothetical protein